MDGLVLNFCQMDSHRESQVYDHIINHLLSMLKNGANKALANQPCKYNQGLK